MATIIPNEFTSYNLNEQEVLEGSVLTIDQKYCLQNQLAIIASELLNILYDPLNPEKFTQEQAYKKGQLDILRHILASSDAAQEALYPPTLSAT